MTSPRGEVDVESGTIDPGFGLAGCERRRSHGWEARAACKGLAELFYSEDVAGQRLALEVCDGCPVLEPCRAALLVEEAGIVGLLRYGVRAGLLPRDRRTRARRRSTLP